MHDAVARVEERARKSELAVHARVPLHDTDFRSFAFAVARLGTARPVSGARVGILRDAAESGARTNTTFGNLFVFL